MSPLSSSSCRRSPTADEEKALGLDWNDGLRTDDSGRKASDATASDKQQLGDISGEDGTMEAGLEGGGWGVKGWTDRSG